MTIRAAPLTFVVALAFALTVYAGAVRPLGTEVDRLRAELLSADLEAVDEGRLDNAPGPGGREVIATMEKVEARVAPAGDVWSRWGPPAPGTAAFPREFRARVRELEQRDVLGRNAWPTYDWETTQTSPSAAECRQAARFFLLVRALTEQLRPRGRVPERIHGISLDRDSDEIELKLDFDPERPSDLLAALTGLRIGGEPFELLSLDATIGDREGLPGTVTLRLRLR